MTSEQTPLNDIEVITYQIPAHGLIPNTSIQKKPLMIYRSAFPPSTTSAGQIEKRISNIGVVVPQWRFTMYSTSHFHTTSHEVLGVATGKAQMCFGHEDNPKKVEDTVSKGDVIVVPAGVAHRLLRDIEGGFEMVRMAVSTRPWRKIGFMHRLTAGIQVGCYPQGYTWDMCYGRASEESKIEKIVAVPWFTRDPVYGDDGPVLKV